MFKQGSHADEIFRSMEGVLVKNQTTNIHENKLSRAVNYLNDAAVIFKQAGMVSEANDIALVIRSLIKGVGND